MQLRADRLRDRPVGRVADEMVCEPERVLSCSSDVSGRISSFPAATGAALPGRSGSRAATGRRRPPTRTPGRRRTLVRSPARSSASSRSSRAASSAWIVGGMAIVDRSLAPPSSRRPLGAARRRRACAASPPRTAGFPPRASAIARERSRPAPPDRSGSVISVAVSAPLSGSRAMRVAFVFPVIQPRRCSSSSGRARQTSSAGSRLDPVDKVLEQVEERRLAPLDVVEDDDEGATGCRGARGASERPRTSPGSPASPTASPSSAARRSPTSSSSGPGGRNRRASRGPRPASRAH